MSKNIYVPVNNIARKVTKGYLPINNIARRIKKGYIGINNIARLFFDGVPRITYYGRITPLRTYRTTMGAASTNTHAIFAGGDEENVVAYVDAYDVNLTHSTPTNLYVARRSVTGESNGSYAIFAGGVGDTQTDLKSNVDAYNTSLTRSTPTGLNVAMQFPAASRNSSYVLFCGGSPGSNTYSNSVTAYSSSLSRTVPTGLRTARTMKAGAYVGDYALFAGGLNFDLDVGSGDYQSKEVDAYNSSLTRTTCTDLPVPYSFPSAFSNGYAVFVNSYGEDKDLTAYNSSLTRYTFFQDLSSARGHQVETLNFGEYGMVAGGDDPTYVFSNVIDVYKGSTKEPNLTLSERKQFFSCACVGQYGLFAGGYFYDSNTMDTPINYSTVEVFKKP